MINTQLSAHDIVFCANESIQELKKNKVELENMRVKLVKERGNQNLEFGLRIIERVGLLMIGAPLVLAFVVSPWTLLITPVAFVAWGILNIVNQNYFSHTLENDYLNSYKERLEGRSIPSGSGLQAPLGREALLVKERAKFFYGEKNYVLNAQKIETANLPQMETLKAIAYLFSSFDFLTQKNLTEFTHSINRCKGSLGVSNLTLKEKEAFAVLLNKITQHSNEIKQKLADMSTTKTLSKEALINYISQLPLSKTE